MLKLRRARVGESGFTLVELLVVMVLLGIVGGIVVSTVTTSFQSSAATTSRVVALNEIEIALQRVTRDLRSAEDFVLFGTGCDGQVEVVITRGGDVQEVTYRVDGDQRLIREETGQQLVTRIGNAADEPLFRYFDVNNNELTDCNSLRDTRRIDIRIVRTLESGTSVSTETQILVRNAKYRSS